MISSVASPSARAVAATPPATAPPRPATRNSRRLRNPGSCRAGCMCVPRDGVNRSRRCRRITGRCPSGRDVRRRYSSARRKTVSLHARGVKLRRHVSWLIDRGIKDSSGDVSHMLRLIAAVRLADRVRSLLEKLGVDMGQPDRAAELPLEARSG